ncbi:hypothetical protein [Methanobrevibacter sp.]
MLINKKSVSVMRNSEKVHHKTGHSDIPTRTVNSPPPVYPLITLTGWPEICS